jgi:Na+-translocating ferredoxin:NAD+ oxidoreductase RNF subunit RnfB
MVFSNYYAQVDEALCTGCETCLERCQMEAMAVDERMLATVDRDRCIGCGLCVTTCPTEAIRLEKKDTDAYQVPPETTFEQMMGMARKRGVI